MEYIAGYVTNLIHFDKYNLGTYSRYLNYKSIAGDIVEIIVDLDKGELSFSINGKEPDIFCEKIDINIDYVPFVDMEFVGSEICLLE